VVRKTQCDQELVKDLVNIGKNYNNKNEIEDVICGKTMCCHDFYEGF
jgi:hypothetical protein